LPFPEIIYTKIPSPGPRVSPKVGGSTHPPRARPLSPKPLGAGASPAWVGAAPKAAAPAPTWPPSLCPCPLRRCAVRPDGWMRGDLVAPAGAAKVGSAAARRHLIYPDSHNSRDVHRPPTRAPLLPRRLPAFPAPPPRPSTPSPAAATARALGRVSPGGRRGRWEGAVGFWQRAWVSRSGLHAGLHRRRATPTQDPGRSREPHTPLSGPGPSFLCFPGPAILPPKRKVGASGAAGQPPVSRGIAVRDARDPGRGWGGGIPEVGFSQMPPQR
jgi:hypothetical protein